MFSKSRLLLSLFVGFLVISTSFELHAQIQRFVPIVRANYFDEMVTTLENVAERYEQEGNSQLARLFRGIAEGGHGSGTVVAYQGRVFLVTNHHVVSGANTVNLEFQLGDGASVSYSDRPVVASDERVDLAVVLLPDALDPQIEALEVFSGALVDGTEVWSAGFPGLFVRPAWQFAAGNVTNSVARIEEIVDPEISYLIQHSAPIDPGNSGGPLLIENADASAGYDVVGINSWTVSGRENTYFAVPTGPMLQLLARAVSEQDGELTTEAVDAELEAFRLQIQALLQADEPDYVENGYLVSNQLLARRGWDTFIRELQTAPREHHLRLEERFLLASPIEAMREGLVYAMHRRLPHQGRAAVAVAIGEVNTTDPSNVAARLEVSAPGVFETVELVREQGNWRVQQISWLGRRPQPEPRQEDPETVARRDALAQPPTGGYRLQLGAAYAFYNLVDDATESTGTGDLNIGFHAMVGVDNEINERFAWSWGVSLQHLPLSIEFTDLFDPAITEREASYLLLDVPFTIRASWPIPRGSRAYVPLAELGIAPGMRIPFASEDFEAIGSDPLFTTFGATFVSNLGVELARFNSFNRIYRFGFQFGYLASINALMPISSDLSQGSYQLLRLSTYFKFGER